MAHEAVLVFLLFISFEITGENLVGGPFCNSRFILNRLILNLHVFWKYFSTHKKDIFFFFNQNH